MFFEYVKHATSPMMVTEHSWDCLRAVGFESVNLSADYSISPGGKYVAIIDGMLLAFTIGKDFSTANPNPQKPILRIAAAHTDHPCLHIKPTAQMTDHGYIRLDTEVYGGPIQGTWFDRPLSMSGIVTLRGATAFETRRISVDFKRPLMTIPNLAIHFTRKDNPEPIKKQKDMLPLFFATYSEPAPLSLQGESTDSSTSPSLPLQAVSAINAVGTVSCATDNSGLPTPPSAEAGFIAFIADEIKADAKDILDFDLFVYNCEAGTRFGRDGEMFMSPRIDNLSSCWALIESITGTARDDGINVAVLFNHEEIGSRTRTGADSSLFADLLKSVLRGAGYGSDVQQMYSVLSDAFLLSVDVAHAFHPAYADVYDPNNRICLNEGITIKINSNQKYTYDSAAVGVVQQLCEKAEVPYKKFANHSDVVGGGTIGTIMSARLPMKAADIGIPILAMHSACETAGVMDLAYMKKLMETYFGE
jgi:aspartyl aminopeptidase